MYLDFFHFDVTPRVKRRDVKINFLHCTLRSLLAIRWTNERREKFTVRIWKRQLEIRKNCRPMVRDRGKSLRFLNSKREKPKISAEIKYERKDETRQVITSRGDLNIWFLSIANGDGILDNTATTLYPPTYFWNKHAVVCISSKK